MLKKKFKLLNVMTWSNEAFYGGTQQEAVIAEVIDGHKLIDLENVVFDW